MPLFVVVLLKKRVIIKKQKEKRKTRNEKTREVKLEIKRRLRPILHQTLTFFYGVPVPPLCTKAITAGR